MATLMIPKIGERALASFIKLSDGEIAALKEAVKNAQPAFSVAQLAGQISSDVGLPAEQIGELIGVLASLYLAAKVDRSVPLHTFSEDVCKALDRSGNPELKLSEAVVPKFRQDIEEFLSFDESLGVTAKALGVMTEHEHVFRAARILTDLRPVFQPDPNEPPAAAVIIHNLKIRYLEGSGPKEFFVALDSNDLRELQAVVERAAKKEASLRSIADRIELRCLTVESE